MTAKVTTGMDIQAAAKELGIKGGRNGLYKLLRQMRIFTDSNKPHHKYVRQGYFRLQTKSYKRGHVDHQYSKPLVTGDGITWLQEQIDKSQAATEAA